MNERQTLKSVARFILAIGMIVVGLQHFVLPEGFAKIIPEFIPFPFTLVYLSGFLETIAGIGLLIPQFSCQSAWTLVILYITVFPANLNQAINNIPVDALPHNPPLIWLRLPFQLFLVSWAGWFTRDHSV